MPSRLRIKGEDAVLAGHLGDQDTEGQRNEEGNTVMMTMPHRATEVAHHLAVLQICTGCLHLGHHGVPDGDDLIRFRRAHVAFQGLADNLVGIESVGALDIRRSRRRSRSRSRSRSKVLHKVLATGHPIGIRRLTQCPTLLMVEPDEPALVGALQIEEGPTVEAAGATRNRRGHNLRPLATAHERFHSLEPPIQAGDQAPVLGHPRLMFLDIRKENLGEVFQKIGVHMGTLALPRRPLGAQREVLIRRCIRQECNGRELENPSTEGRELLRQIKEIVPAAIVGNEVQQIQCEIRVARVQDLHCLLEDVALALAAADITHVEGRHEREFGICHVKDLLDRFAGGTAHGAE